MSAQVANVAMVGSAARLSRALSVAGSARQQVDGIGGSSAAPPRDGAQRYDGSSDRYDSGAARRNYGPLQDNLITFGGVLVSREVGATIVQLQALGSFPLPPVEAEKQIANYEFAQSLVGPAEAMPVVQPFQ
ncbi:MAG: hypothetical protein EPO08_18715 [Rhodospirillaceae bacterium]|nr:MAG: hypothetical protein EPO08_18715 [Rhodospirillaceae bacterium]